MAQVIITKNGTGSATPTSLVQGELGLNVSTGQLFYGTSGSSNSVSSSYLFSAISVSGDIIANGHIRGDSQTALEGIKQGTFENFVSGSSVKAAFGFDVTKGNVTASGNINTTGIIQIEGVNAIDYASSTHLFGANSSFTKLRSTVGIEMTAPITASGDISASGQVYDNTYHQWEASARVDSDDDSNWQAPSGKGILATEDWAQDFAGDYDHPTGSYAASRLTMNTGWYMSTGVNYSASLKSMEIWVQANSNQSYDADTGFTCSLWYSNASDVAGEYNQFGSNAGTFVQRHAAQVDSGQFKNHTSDELFKYNTYLVTQSIDIDLAPGSWIFPRFKTFGSSNFVANVYWTVNYCKKPL